MSDPLSFWYVKVMLYAAFASFGGVMGHVLRTINRNEKVRWQIAAAEGMGAGFVGVLVYFACQAMNVPEAWTGVIVGVCGWLGASATIAMLETLVRKRLGIDGSPHDDQKQG